MARQATAIPDGYHTITPALSIRDAARAVEFYQQAFNAQQLDRLEGPDGKVMHAALKIGNSILMLGEEHPQMGAPSPLTLNGTPVSLYLYVEDADAAFSQAVKAGAKIELPVSDQFWGDRTGQVSDPFGHRWWLATHKEDLTPAQIKQRAAKAMAPAPTA
jgi:uncharacterized glyoxalase superfamily protein PhnB